MCSSRTYIDLSGTTAQCCTRKKSGGDDCIPTANYCSPKTDPANPCIPTDYCAPGYGYSGTRCQVCPANTATPSYGKNVCERCTIHSTAAAGSAQCKDCGANGWGIPTSPGNCMGCPNSPKGKCPYNAQEPLELNVMGIPAACCYWDLFGGLCNTVKNNKVCQVASGFPLCEC